MAIAAWKRFERSTGYQRMKTSLSRLIGTDLRLLVDTRVETIESGGWCFTTQGLDQDSIIYSLGVRENIEFDFLSSNASVLKFMPSTQHLHR